MRDKTMITKLKNGIVRFRKDEKGAALIEYSILIGIITAGVITIVLAVGTWVTAQWTTLNTALGLAAP